MRNAVLKTFHYNWCKKLMLRLYGILLLVGVFVIMLVYVLICVLICVSIYIVANTFFLNIL